MIKSLFLLFILHFPLWGEVYHVRDFESDIFSRNGNKLKKISLSLRMEGRDLKESDYKIIDALNIIVSSFYLEDLFTSKGKELFKTSLSKYLEKKYSVEADRIFFEKFKLIESFADIDAFIAALKAEGCCQKSRSIKKVFEKLPE